MDLTIPERALTNPRRFVIEIAADGFNAYEQQPGGSFELIAASPKAVASSLQLWEENIAPAFVKVLKVVEGGGCSST